MLTIVTLVKDNAIELSSQREVLCSLSNSNVTWYIKDSSKNQTDLDILSDLKENWQGNTALVVDSSRDFGLYNAFNVACNASVSKYICNFNPDDKILLEDLRQFISHLTKVDDDFIICPLWVENKNRPPGPRKKSGNVNLNGFRSNLDGCATSLVFSKKLYDRLGGFNEKWPLASDLDFMLKIIAKLDTLKFHEYESPIGVYGKDGVSSKLSFSSARELWDIYTVHLKAPYALFLLAKSLFGRFRNGR
jgi:hypothetical protein